MDKAGGVVRRHGAKVLGAAGVVAGAALTKGIVDSIHAEAAVDKMAAQIGLTEPVSARVGQVAGDLFASAYGSSLGQVNDALVGVHRNIGDVGTLSNAELSSMGANALDLATVMDEDVGRVTRGVGQLMRNDLAPSAQAAFDLIAAAAQSPANATGDLIDTIEEYSTDFSALGLTGPQAMGALSGAMEAGARNTDLVADAFREFSIRVLDGSDLSREAVTALGLDYDSLAQTISGGGPAAAEATSQVIQALSGVGDQVLQEQLGVALFGTRFEELGPQVLGAMDPIGASLTDVEGRAGKLGDTLNDNAQTKIEGWRRKFSQVLMQLVDAPGFIGGTTAAVAGLGGAILPMGGDLGGMALGMTAVSGKFPAFGKGLGKLRGGAVDAAKSVGRFALSLVGMVVRMAVTAAATVVHVAVMVAGWVLLGVQSLLAAAKVALAWLIALGPIAIVAAAVIALVVLIVANWDTIKAAVAAGWAFVARVTTSVWNAIKGFLSGAWNSIKAAASAAWNAIKTAIGNAWNSIRGAVGNGISNVLGLVRSLPGRILGALGNLGRLLFNAGRNVIQGLIDGIRNMIGGVGRAISGVASTIRNFLPFSPAKEGPLSGRGNPLLAGQSIAEMVAAGMLSKTSLVISAAARMAQATKGFVRMGDVSSAEWEALKAAGWRGRAGDRMEALYAPAGAAAGGGGGGVSAAAVRAALDGLSLDVELRGDGTGLARLVERGQARLGRRR